MISSINQLYGTQNLILQLINDFSPISTIKLQKLLFIAQYGLDLPSNLVFAPFLYGPYCAELSNEILPALQAEGFIRVIRYNSDKRSPTVKKYSLTQLGNVYMMQVVQPWLTNNIKIKKKYSRLNHSYNTSTREIISASYDLFRKTITPRLLYLNQRTLNERAPHLSISRISEKIQLQIPLETDMMLDPLAEFVLEDFRESAPIYLSANKLYSAFRGEELSLGAQIKIYGCFHEIKEEDSELTGIFSHHFHSKNVGNTHEKTNSDIICKLKKNAEICYHKDFLGYICEMGGLIVEDNPLTIEPIYVLGYYPREFQP